MRKFTIPHTIFRDTLSPVHPRHESNVDQTLITFYCVQRFIRRGDYQVAESIFHLFPCPPRLLIKFDGNLETGESYGSAGLPRQRYENLTGF